MEIESILTAVIAKNEWTLAVCHFTLSLDVVQQACKEAGLTLVCQFTVCSIFCEQPGKSDNHNHHKELDNP